MSADRVDVLAVLDNLVCGGKVGGAQLREARAAVDELIESCSVLLVEWDRQDHGMFDVMPAKDWEAAEARFRAALARVGVAP